MCAYCFVALTCVLVAIDLFKVTGIRWQVTGKDYRQGILLPVSLLACYLLPVTFACQFRIEPSSDFHPAVDEIGTILSPG